MLACLLGRGPGFGIAAEAVIEQCARVIADAQPHAFATARHVVDSGLDKLASFGLATSPGSERDGAVGRELGPSHLGDRAHLLHQRCALVQLAREHVHEDAGPEGDREHGERTCLPCELDMTSAQHLPALVIPQVIGHASSEPQPAQPFLGGDVLAAESAQRSFQQRCAGGAAVRDQQRQAVEEKIGRAGRCRRRGRQARRS